MNDNDTLELDHSGDGIVLVDEFGWRCFDGDVVSRTEGGWEARVSEMEGVERTLDGSCAVAVVDGEVVAGGRIDTVNRTDGDELLIEVATRPTSHDIESHRKGERNERQAGNILNRLYRAERVDAYGNSDPFRLADIMGLQSGLPVALVQVKTNRFEAEARRYYRSWARSKVDGKHSVFEVWVRRDRKGWEMHRYNPDSEEFEVYYETGTCDPNAVRDEWAEAYEGSLVSSEG